MIFLLPLFCFFVFSLSGQEQVVEVSSGEAFFDGKEMVLLGQVDAEHGIGKVSAKKLGIVFSPEGKSYLLNIYDDIHIVFQRGGEVFCQNAQVDYTALKSTFKGNECFPEVIFRKGTEFEMTSKEVSLQLEKIEGVGKFDITTLQAEGGITLKYDDHYMLEGKSATYDHHSSVVVLEGSPCQLTQIDAQSKRLAFSANQMKWNSLSGVLDLRGEIQATYGDSLTLSGADEISLVQMKEEVQGLFSSLSASGKIELLHENESKQIRRKILCPGQVTINHLTKEVFLSADSETQVCIQDFLGEMYADKIHMTYQFEEDQFDPLKIVLEGHIRIKNICEASEEATQFIIADRVEIHPKANEMFLFGEGATRVLLDDRLNQMQLSAPAMKIVYDPVLKKERVEGIGVVRFVFVDQEVQKLKGAFKAPVSIPKRP